LTRSRRTRPTAPLTDCVRTQWRCWFNDTRQEFQGRRTQDEMNLTLSHRIFVAVLVLLAAFMLPGHAQAQPSNEAIWQQFVQWLPSAPPFDNPGPLFSQYRSRLIAAGASAAEADRQMVIIRRTMQERPDGWRIIFNNIYSTSTPGFSTQPNRIHVRTVSCDLGSLCRASTQIHEVWWVDRDRELWRRCYDAQSTTDGHRSRTVACGVQGFSSAALRGHYGRARLGTAEEAYCPHGRRKAAVRSV
jgi:hypothetical protein